MKKKKIILRKSLRKSPRKKQKGARREGLEEIAAELRKTLIFLEKNMNSDIPPEKNRDEAIIIPISTPLEG